MASSPKKLFRGLVVNQLAILNIMIYLTNQTLQSSQVWAPPPPLFGIFSQPPLSVSLVRNSDGMPGFWPILNKLVGIETEYHREWQSLNWYCIDDTLNYMQVWYSGESRDCEAVHLGSISRPVGSITIWLRGLSPFPDPTELLPGHLQWTSLWSYLQLD